MSKRKNRKRRRASAVRIRSIRAAAVTTSAFIMFSGAALPFQAPLQVYAASTAQTQSETDGTWQEARINGITWRYQVDSSQHAVNLYASSGNISGALDANGMLIVPGQVGGYSVASIGGGTINMPFYSAENADATVNGIIFPSTMTEIEDYAFYNVYMTPKDVTIPGTVTSIGKYAFAGSGIESLSITGFTGTIGEGAFSACTELSSTYIQTANGSGVKIDKNAFANDAADANLIINAGGTINIGEYAFSGNGVSQLSLEGDIYLGTRSFAGCDSLTAVYLGKGVRFSGTGPFTACSALTYVDTDINLPDDAFDGCGSITTLITEQDVKIVSAEWNGTTAAGKTMNVYVRNGNTLFGSGTNISAFGSEVGAANVFYEDGGDKDASKNVAHGNHTCATYAQSDDWTNLITADVTFYCGTFSEEDDKLIFKSDDGSDLEVDNGITETDAVSAAYSGCVRTGEKVDKDKMTVISKATGEKVSEFYILRKTDADELMSSYQSGSTSSYESLLASLQSAEAVTAESSDLLTADGNSGLIYASVIAVNGTEAVQADVNIRVEKLNIDTEDADYKTFQDMLDTIHEMQIRSTILDNAVRRADDTNKIVMTLSSDDYEKTLDTVNTVLELASTPADQMTEEQQTALDTALDGLSEEDLATVQEAMADYAQTSEEGTISDIFKVYLTNTCGLSESDAEFLMSSDLESDDVDVQTVLETLTDEQQDKAKELAECLDGYQSLSSETQQEIKDEVQIILDLAEETKNLTSLQEYTRKANELRTALQEAENEVESAKEQYNNLSEALSQYAESHTAGNIDFIGVSTEDNQDVVYLNGTAYPYDKDSGVEQEITLNDGVHTVMAYTGTGYPWKYIGDVSVEKGSFKFYAMLDGIHIFEAMDQNGNYLSIDPNLENSAENPLGGIFTQSLTDALTNAVAAADSVFQSISDADETMASYIDDMISSGLLDESQKIDLTGDTVTDTEKIADAMKALIDSYQEYRDSYTEYQQSHTITSDQVQSLLDKATTLEEKADDVETYVSDMMTEADLSDEDKEKLTDILTSAVNVKNTAIDDEEYFTSLKNAFGIAEETNNKTAAQQIINTVTLLRKQATEMTDTYNELSDKYSALKSEADAEDTTNENLQSALSKANSDKTALQKSLSTANSSNSASAKKLSDLQSQYNTLNSKYNTLSQQSKNKDSQISALQQQLAEAKKSSSSSSGSTGSSSYSPSTSYSSGTSSPSSSSTASSTGSTDEDATESSTTGTSTKSSSSIPVTSGTSDLSDLLSDSSSLSDSYTSEYTPTSQTYSNGFTNSSSTADTASDASALASTDSTEEAAEGSTEEEGMDSRTKMGILMILLAVLLGAGGVFLYLWKAGKIHLGGKAAKKDNDLDDLDDLADDDDDDDFMDDELTDDFGADDETSGTGSSDEGSDEDNDDDTDSSTKTADVSESDDDEPDFGTDVE